MDAGAQHHRPRVAPVCAGCNAVQRPKGAGKGLLPGKAVVQRDVQQRTVGVPHLLQGEGQPPLVQVCPQGHARQLPELAGGVVLGIVQALRQCAKRQRLVVVAEDGLIHLVDHVLDQPVPFVHPIAPFCRWIQDTPVPAKMLDNSCSVQNRDGSAVPVCYSASATG